MSGSSMSITLEGPSASAHKTYTTEADDGLLHPSHDPAPRLTSKKKVRSRSSRSRSASISPADDGDVMDLQEATDTEWMAHTANLSGNCTFLLPNVTAAFKLLRSQLDHKQQRGSQKGNGQLFILKHCRGSLQCNVCGNFQRNYCRKYKPTGTRKWSCSEKFCLTKEQEEGAGLKTIECTVRASWERTKEDTFVTFRHRGSHNHELYTRRSRSNSRSRSASPRPSSAPPSPRATEFGNQQQMTFFLDTSHIDKKRRVEEPVTLRPHDSGLPQLPIVMPVSVPTHNAQVMASSGSSSSVPLLAAAKLHSTTTSHDQRHLMPNFHDDTLMINHEGGIRTPNALAPEQAPQERPPALFDLDSLR